MGLTWCGPDRSRAVHPAGGTLGERLAAVERAERADVEQLADAECLDDFDRAWLRLGLALNRAGYLDLDDLRAAARAIDDHHHEHRAAADDHDHHVHDGSHTVG